MPPDMANSWESKGIRPAGEGAAEVRKRVELRQLLWRFLLAFALIAGPVGVATMIAHWMPPVH